jgi:uncharacterized protein YegL
MRNRLIVVFGCVSILLTVIPIGAQVEQIDHLVVVLDASGSMERSMGVGEQSTEKMAAAKAALKQVLVTLPNTTQVGVLVFPSTGWVFELAPFDYPRLEAALDAVRPGGGTPLGAFIKRGADRLLERRRDQLGLGSYRLLVITDGEAGDQELVESYIPDVMSRGIKVEVIGVDMTTDHTLATKVHTYRRADDPSELTQAIRDVVAEVTAADATDTADGDAFDLIAALPDGLAVEIIDELAASGNHPIGEQPQLKLAATPVPDANAAAAGGAPKEKPQRSKRGGSLFVVFLAVAGLAIALRFLKRR